MADVSSDAPSVCKVSYHIQLGTAFDAGQSLTWTLVTGESLVQGNVFAPRPRKYRAALPKLASSYDGTPAPLSKLDRLFGTGQSADNVSSVCVLRAPEIMQTAARFCPDGHWFSGLGARMVQYRGVLSPAPVTVFLSLRNPALMLSEAWASGKYPGFDAAPPDPFDLQWATVLADLRAHCPDVPIVAWPAEDMATIWRRILVAAVGDRIDVPASAQIQFAKSVMREDGWASLDTYLATHPDMPDTFRTRVIGMFIGRFPIIPNVSIPGWSTEVEARMADHYAADLAVVDQMDGVTLIKG